ncbi:hypothetical protein [Croceibacterium soli]
MRRPKRCRMHGGTDPRAPKSDRDCEHPS